MNLWYCFSDGLLLPTQCYGARGLKENVKTELLQQPIAQFLKPCDMDFSGVRVRVWTSCPIIHKKINLIALPTAESVHSKCWLAPIGHEVSSGCEVVSGQPRRWQRSPAPHGSAQLATVDRKPRQMASKQTAPISIWSGLNQMPGGERSVEWPWSRGWRERSSWSWCWE